MKCNNLIIYAALLMIVFFFLIVTTFALRDGIFLIMWVHTWLVAIPASASQTQALLLEAALLLLVLFFKLGSRSQKQFVFPVFFYLVGETMISWALQFFIEKWLF